MQREAGMLAEGEGMMQQSENFRLVARRGPQPNQAFELSKEITTLGRDITNDIVINDRETSRNHLRLMRSGDTVSIEDLGSTNGTFVNGKRASGVTPLQNGDMIGLGETVLLALELYRAAPSAPPAAEAQPPAATPTPAPQQAYTPPAEYGLQGTAPPPPAEAYAPPSAEAIAQPQPAYPAYAEQPPAPQQQPTGYYPQAPGYAQQQPVPGYDYDPYAAREESGGTSPWLILGCFVFFVLVFVCIISFSLFLIDELNLWCEVPVLVDIVRALNFGC